MQSVSGDYKTVHFAGTDHQRGNEHDAGAAVKENTGQEVWA